MDIHSLLTPWSFDPTITGGVILAAVLYFRGMRYMRRAGLRLHVKRWQLVAFVAALVLTVVALQSPLDALADIYLIAHMVQHDLLIFFVALLLVLSEPAMPLWRGVPLAWRRYALGWALRRPPIRHVGHKAGWIAGSSVLVWVLFAGNLTAWHIPALYDLALEHEPVHVLEHLLYLGTAVIFWAQVIPSAPLRPRLSYLSRSLYLFAAAVEMHIIALTLLNSVKPYYAYYADLPRHAGMISAVMDQTIAGTLLDAPGFLYLVIILVYLSLWIQQDMRVPDPSPPTFAEMTQRAPLAEEPVETKAHATAGPLQVVWSAHQEDASEDDLGGVNLAQTGTE